VRAEGDVVLLRGDDRIAAQQLSLFLAADDETPRAVEAKWQVEGRIAQRDDVGARADFDFRSKLATIDFDGSPAQPTRIALESERGEQVLLSAPGPDGLRREIAAHYLVATLVGGRLTTAQGFQPVYFSEHLAATPDKPLRTGQADQVEADFDAVGRPSKLTFVGRVSFRDAGIEGKGERGFIDLERGRAELFGKRVQVTSDRGELIAPHLTWDRTTGLVTADGGVQARLDPQSASLLAGAQAGARGPVRVEAQEAILQERPRGFVFRGKVQAWQGESVLFADQLRGEETEQRLSAAGGVKTIWREVAGGAGAPVQTEITAATLAYRRAERTVTYAGAVLMRQGERTLAADELVASLGEDERVSAMVATGRVRLEERGSGRTVAGDRVEYDLARRTALFAGAPVVLEDRQGTRIQGRKLLYDLASGSARMLSEAP
jgi:lipopolysaccharide transport protein LptA